METEFSKDGFFPGMKVSLDGEFGVVTDQVEEWDGSYFVNEHKHQGNSAKLYGIIRWDTSNEYDFEDWRGIYGSFIQAGGFVVALEHEFNYINDNGQLKE